MDSGRGHKPGLAHVASHHLADSSRLPDGGRCSQQQGADGSTESLGQADGNGIEQRRDFHR